MGYMDEAHGLIECCFSLKHILLDHHHTDPLPPSHHVHPPTATKLFFSHLQASITSPVDTCLTYSSSPHHLTLSDPLQVFTPLPPPPHHGK